eukprot:PITA_35742
MKLISWNVRGLNSPSKHRMIKNLIQQEKPTIVFLQETKSSTEAIERIRGKVWAGSSAISVDAFGASVGLAILWNPQIITLYDFHATLHLIQASFHLIGTEIHGHLTNVYFPHTIQQKLELLEMISILNENRKFSLSIGGGDFNIITSMAKKQGGRIRLHSDSEGLKEFIQNNHLMDLPTSNGIFTWTNKRRGIHLIASKLDRFLLSHNAIHLGGRGNRCNRPFRFEAFWLTKATFKTVVSDAWAAYIQPEGAKMYQFQQKLKNLKYVIKVWNRTNFGNIQEKHSQLEQQMHILQQTLILEGRSEEQAQQEQILWNQIEEHRKQEEILWRQKSRINWLKEGGKNIKFFHKATIQRRMHNNITFIKNQQGERIEEHEDMEKEFTGYLKEILTEPIENRDTAIRAITQHIPSIITEDHNNRLLQPTTL